jgi:hypothetical protein
LLKLLLQVTQRPSRIMHIWAWLIGHDAHHAHGKAIHAWLIGHDEVYVNFFGIGVIVAGLSFHHQSCYYLMCAIMASVHARLLFSYLLYFISM